MTCKYDTYDGKGVESGPGWYGNTTSGVVQLFGKDKRNQPQDGGFGSAWYPSREAAERELNHSPRPRNNSRGGHKQTRYSLRRRRGRKHKSRRGGKK